MRIYYLEQLEKYSAIFSVLTIYFGVQQRLVTWPISIIICLGNLPLYYYRKVYASCFQNFVYIVASFYGWYTWRYGGADHTELTTITATSGQEGLLIVIGVCLYMVVMNPILVRLGGSVTFLDAFRSALTMAGMWLTSHKKVEAYLVWFLVNIVSATLFHRKGMPWFRFKYLFYLCFSLYGYWSWWGQYQTQQEGAAS